MLLAHKNSIYVMRVLKLLSTIILDHNRALKWTLSGTVRTLVVYQNIENPPVVILESDKSPLLSKRIENLAAGSLQ